jgi:hypothetical protein
MYNTPLKFIGNIDIFIIENKKPTNPINILASDKVMKDINNIRNPYGSFME